MSEKQDFDDMTPEQQPQSAMDTSEEDEAWQAYNAAIRLDAYPSYHPGFKRVIESIEQHDPIGLVEFPDLPGTFHYADEQQPITKPELPAGHECSNCGTRYYLYEDAHCPRCAANHQADADIVKQLVSEATWLEPATEDQFEDAGDSGYLFDEEPWDDDDWY